MRPFKHINGNFPTDPRPNSTQFRAVAPVRELFINILLYYVLGTIMTATAENASWPIRNCERLIRNEHTLLIRSRESRSSHRHVTAIIKYKNLYTNTPDMFICYIHCDHIGRLRITTNTGSNRGLTQTTAQPRQNLVLGFKNPV